MQSIDPNPDQGRGLSSEAREVGTAAIKEREKGEDGGCGRSFRRWALFPFVNPAESENHANVFVLVTIEVEFESSMLDIPPSLHSRAG